MSTFENENHSDYCTSGNTDFSDLDIEEVLIESIALFQGKVTVDKDFFSPGKMNEFTGDSSFDAAPPTRKQIVGATAEYIDSLKGQPEVVLELVPEFTEEELNQPSNVFWDYPRAVPNYGFFEEKMVPILSNGGIKKLICREGRGTGLQVGNNVLINYYIYAEGYKYCVDSNKIRKTPLSFVIGRKQDTTPVLELGTLSMKVKEVAAFLATPRYAFGTLGMGPWIPETSRVLCIIEVLAKLASPSESSSMFNMVPNERKLLPFQEVYRFTVELKLEGTKNLKKSKTARALRKYLQAVTFLQDAIPKDDKQTKQKVTLLLVLYRNISGISLNSGQLSTAVQFARHAIALPVPEQDKAHDYIRCATGLYLQQKFDEAKQTIDTAVGIWGDKEEVTELRTYIYSASAAKESVKVKDGKKRKRSFSSLFQLSHK